MHANLIEREVAHAMRCGACARPLEGRDVLRAYRRGLKLAQGTLTTNELICASCHDGLPASARSEWIPLADALD